MSNNDETNNNTGEREIKEKEDTKECSICFETLHTDLFSTLPCCGLDGREETSTIKVCNGCLIILSIVTTPSSSSSSSTNINNDSNTSTRIGKCPRCRYWLSIKTTKDAIDGNEKG